MISFTGQVKRFTGKAAWYYLPVPDKLLPTKIPTGPWGFSKITARVGNTTWKTSLLPLGDGSKFIALKAQVRKKENIDLGTKVKISFWLEP